MTARKLLKILVLGALVAGVFWAVQGPPGDDSSRPQIVISEADVAHQSARWQRMWNRSPSAEELFSYHTLHDPALPAHSVLMRRPDARTVSLSQVSVDPERIRFSYGTVSEQCRFDGPTTISLNRVD